MMSVGGRLRTRSEGVVSEVYAWMDGVGGERK